MRRYSILVFMGIGIIFLLSSCRRVEKIRAEALSQELQGVGIMTPAFDSLVGVSMELPKFFRAKVLLTAGTRYSVQTEQMKKAKGYLKEALRIAPRDVKNQVTLELARLYGLLVLRDDCAEEAILFMSRARSKVVFAREEEAEFYYLKALFFKSINIDRSFEAIDKAIYIYRGISDTRGEIEAFCFKATLHGVLEEFDSQYACYEEAYRLLKKMRHREGVRPFYEQMAASLKRLGRHEEALKWYGEVLKDRSDTTDLGRYGIQVAEAYSGLGMHARAREILKQALAGEGRTGLRNVLLERVANSFLQEGVRDSAMVYFKTAIDLYDGYAREKNLKIPNVLYTNYLNYSRCLWEYGEQDKALAELERVSRRATDTPEGLRAQMEVLNQLSEYYEALNLKEEFCEAFRRCDSVMDIYQTRNEDGRYRNVLQKYKNRKLLREIELMSKKQDETNWWLVLSLVVTLGMIGVVVIYTLISWKKMKRRKM